jgi:hypothetical protein
MGKTSVRAKPSAVDLTSNGAAARILAKTAMLSVVSILMIRNSTNVSRFLRFGSERNRYAQERTKTQKKQKKSGLRPL